MFREVNYLITIDNSEAKTSEIDNIKVDGNRLENNLIPAISGKKEVEVFVKMK
jgi:hypothetical protein